METPMQQEDTAALDAFERAAAAVAALRVPIRQGRASTDDIRRHAARTAARFYFDTIGRRTSRLGHPDAPPEPPAKVRDKFRD